MKGVLSVVAFLPLWAGCATAMPSELDDETATDDQIVGDAATSPAGAYTYFQIYADLRRCASPMCGGWWVERLNRTATKCYDGEYRESCYVPWLDWSEARLSDASRAELLQACSDGASAPGVVAIVRGRLGPHADPFLPDLGSFVITEAWVAENDAVSDGVFVRIQDNGLRCFSAPCPHLDEMRLNTHRATPIDEIDLARAGLTPGQEEALVAAEYSERGILVAGHRYDVYANGHAGRGRAITAAYRMLPRGRTCGTPPVTIDPTGP